jgi:hypothetical protein
MIATRSVFFRLVQRRALVEVTSGNGDFLAPDMKRSKGGGKVEV